MCAGYVPLRLLMPSTVGLPPLERCQGTKPIHAASWRPLANAFESPMLATNALTVEGPIAEIAVSSQLA